MRDRTGRELSAGCWVDLFISDIVTAFVISCEDGGLAGPDGRVQPAMIVLQIAIPMKLPPGAPANVYLVREAERKEEKQVLM
jgi:hypothetical protein